MTQMKNGYAAQGFTLVELMVTVTILVLLVFAIAPLTTNWVYSAQNQDARSKFVRGYGMAKALALRNRSQAPLSAFAAGIRLVVAGTKTTMLVCDGDPAAATCAANVTGTTVKWQTTFADNVNVFIAGVLTTATNYQTIRISSEGIPSSGTDYLFSHGGSQNDERGKLY